MLHESHAPVLPARNGKTLLMHCAAYAHIREASKAQISCQEEAVGTTTTLEVRNSLGIVGLYRH